MNSDMPVGQRTSVATPYGRVDAAALQRLQRDFDTTRLLRAVDTVDRVGAGLVDPEGLRSEILLLHAMAHTVLNGGALVAPTSVNSIGECAGDVSEALDELILALVAIRDDVRRLADLSDQDE